MKIQFEYRSDKNEQKRLWYFLLKNTCDNHRPYLVVDCDLSVIVLLTSLAIDTCEQPRKKKLFIYFFFPIITSPIRINTIDYTYTYILKPDVLILHDVLQPLMNINWSFFKYTRHRHLWERKNFPFSQKVIIIIKSDKARM